MIDLGTMDIRLLEIEFGKLQTDEQGYKNSIMTFYRLREKNLRKIIFKNKQLYKKE